MNRDSFHGAGNHLLEVRSWKLAPLRDFQTLLRSFQMSTPGILERRRRLNAERSEAVERHEVPLESYNTTCSEVPIPKSNQSNQSSNQINPLQTVHCRLKK